MCQGFKCVRWVVCPPLNFGPCKWPQIACGPSRGQDARRGGCLGDGGEEQPPGRPREPERHSQHKRLPCNHASLCVCLAIKRRGYGAQKNPQKMQQYERQAQLGISKSSLCYPTVINEGNTQNTGKIAPVPVGNTNLHTKGGPIFYTCFAFVHTISHKRNRVQSTTIGREKGSERVFVICGGE